MSNWVLPLVLAILGFGGLLYFFNKKIEELKNPQDDSGMKMMLQVVSELRRDVESGHGKNREEMTAMLNQIQTSLTKHQTDSSQTLQQQWK